VNTKMAADDLESLNKEFPGLEWKMAFGPRDCTNSLLGSYWSSEYTFGWSFEYIHGW
jgi:hypothetical protein